MYEHFFKRYIDFIIASGVLLFVSVLFVLIIVWLYIVNKGTGVFFLQERPGRNRKIFKVIKFKTMTDERDQMGNLLPDEKRLTRVGKFMRSTSLDELPQ